MSKTLNYKNDYKVISSYTDFNKFVELTYNKPYDIQQQNECMKEESFIRFSVPCDMTFVEDYNDHGSFENYSLNKYQLFGVSFQTWLDTEYDHKVFNGNARFIWERNYYPNFEILINDLYEKGLLEKGEYLMLIT